MCYALCVHTELAMLTIYVSFKLFHSWYAEIIEYL